MRIGNAKEAAEKRVAAGVLRGTTQAGITGRSTLGFRPEKTTMPN